MATSEGITHMDTIPRRQLATGADELLHEHHRPVSGPHTSWRNRALGWLARLGKGLLVLLPALAGLGLVYEAVATEADARRFPPPGQMVDVGGYRLHFNCVGEGSPTVILESGLPGAVPVWGWVQPQVALMTRVCAYDRAGDGWSEPGPAPRDATRIAGELHTLLTNAGIQGPFVLVGHSFGGIFTRVFASRFPEQVVGMVLIDALHPDQWNRTPVAGKFYNKATTSVAPPLARVGVVRFILNFIMSPDPNLPTKQQAELRAILSGTRVWESDRAVYQTLDETMAEARAVSSLGSLPLTVLTATEHGDSPDGEFIHQQLQAELAALSSNSRHQIVQGATHNSLIDDREQSHITVDAIRQVLDQAGGVSRSNTQTY